VDGMGPRTFRHDSRLGNSTTCAIPDFPQPTTNQNRPTSKPDVDTWVLQAGPAVAKDQRGLFPNRQSQYLIRETSVQSIHEESTNSFPESIGRCCNKTRLA
jgi:hypothetical protein